MLHEKIELRRILKNCMRETNRVPFGARDKEVVKIRTLISRKIDALGKEIFKELGPHD